MSNKKIHITFGKAITPIIFLIAILFWSLKDGSVTAQIPLLLTASVAAAIAISSGYKWEQIEDGLMESLKMALKPALIIFFVGMIIGTWIVSGVVPSMIYYGLKIINPNFFLVTSLLLCCVISTASGSSWTTVSTVGIALMGIGFTLGIPAPVTVGAIISGSYFGDKMSPLSDTTNLAPAVAGADLFDHIKHMIYTTGTSLILSIIFFGIFDFRYGGSTINDETIRTVLNALSTQFTISPILLLPLILVIVIVIKKVPALPGLGFVVVVASVLAIILQGTTFGEILSAAQYGYVSETGIEVIDALLTRGGIDSMMYNVQLLICAMILGGVLESTGMLQIISEKIAYFVRGTGSLVATTVFSSIFINTATGDQYLSIAIPGRMYKKLYDKQNLHPKNLSRALEDGGTLTSPLVPWNVCGAFMAATLGVPTLVYLPFAFLNYINPLVSIIFGFLGITMTKLDFEEQSIRSKI